MHHFSFVHYNLSFRIGQQHHIALTDMAPMMSIDVKTITIQITVPKFNLAMRRGPGQFCFCLSYVTSTGPAQLLECHLIVNCERALFSHHFQSALLFSSSLLEQLGASSYQQGAFLQLELVIHHHKLEADR